MQQYLKPLALSVIISSALSACGNTPAAPTYTPLAVSGDFVLQAEDYQANNQSVVTTRLGDGHTVAELSVGAYIEFAIDIDQSGLYELSYQAATEAELISLELWLSDYSGKGSARVNQQHITKGGTLAEVKGDQAFNIWAAGKNTLRLRVTGSKGDALSIDLIRFKRIGDVDPSVDIDGDGVADKFDQCSATAAGASVNEFGCSAAQLDDDNDGVSNAVDQCPNTPEGALVDEMGCEFKVIDVNTADPSLPSFLAFNHNGTPEGKRWEKVDNMSDEFDRWDDSKWIKTNWNYGDTPVNMLNKNSGVSDGHLWIQATLNTENKQQWFETSRVRSIAKIKYPIYTESRIKVANISAYSTYWLNNGDINNRDEFDIIEINPRPSCRCQPTYPWQMNSQYFIVKNGKTERRHGNSNNKNLSDANTLQGVRWNEEFHVFGAWWIDEHTVQFYLNGEPVNSVNTKQPFTREQHIIWDLWTQDSTWVGGLPKKEDLLNDDNNTMKIDWVRTWRLVDE